MMFLYVAALSFGLLAYIFYHTVTALEWEENERRRLQNIQLHLAHILTLLEAPDVRYYIHSKPKIRQALLLDFSECMKRDVQDLWRMRALGPESVVWAALFFLSYYVIRAKSRLVCCRNDLRFLTRLELALVRTVEVTR